MRAAIRFCFIAQIKGVWSVRTWKGLLSKYVGEVSFRSKKLYQVSDSFLDKTDISNHSSNECYCNTELMAKLEAFTTKDSSTP